MEMPVELRRRPPRPTLEWVAGRFGPDARVVGVRRLRNAWAAAVHAVDIEAPDGERHEVVLRRWVRADQPPDPGVVENEAAALSVVASAAALTTPVLVAFDVTAAFTDVPALVMTRLHGHDVLAPPDLDAFLDGLVASLRAIHSVAIPPASGIGEYRPWGLELLADAPGWSRRPDVWRRAIAIARRPVPAAPTVLCHRDFHPGNVLWHRGRVSGVVDWTHTCLGPAAADVAHCRTNLALLFGLEVADEFARRYGPVADRAWFDIVDTVGAGDPEVWRWHDAGRADITVDTVVRTRDDLLAAAVAQLD
jgi:aminoglycoside phosphotransferase (APT) family kinase protein